MKIRIDFTDAGIGDYIHQMNSETMWHLLRGLVTEDESEVEWKRLSKFVYNLELPLTSDDT
jgi:hypothetical protein